MLNLVILFLLGLSCIAQSKPVTKSTIAIIKYDGKEIQTHNFIIAPNDLSNVYILSLAEIEKRSDAGMLKGKQVAILTLKENIPLLSLPELLYYSKLDSNSQNLRVNVDEKIADLITEGCNMGIKSISRYLNQYPNSRDDVKDLVHELIKIEDKLVHELRSYL